MEKASCLGPGVDCYNVGQVIVRTGATVSQRSYLCTASHDPRDRGFGLVVGAIEIGPGAWIAAEAFIGPGVIVGQDALVGARAVVVKDVPPNAIIAGNPARLIGERYTDHGTVNLSDKGE
jgi:putative colanic acid biosynthesis acetyltransferase WcaF